MNNLEFAHHYNLAKLEVSDLSDEQLIAFRDEKVRQVELFKIKVQVANDSIKERTIKTKFQIRESDLEYVMPPADDQLDKLATKLAKSGQSERFISDIKLSVKNMNFDDL